MNASMRWLIAAMTALLGMLQAADNHRHLDAALAIHHVKTLDQNWPDVAGPASAGIGSPTQITLPNAVAWLAFKARRLSGIRATAPYLHSGCVLSLTELLEPASERDTQSHVGGMDFDPVVVGFRNDEIKPLFDTTLEGTTNAGHEHVTTQSDTERQ